MENNNWQYVSLEPAKEMKELGFKQESLFYYNQFGDIVGDVYDKNWKADNWKMELYSAYTVAELGEMLPEGTEITRAFGRLEYWNVNFRHKEISKCYSIGSENEADARAKMLIYLAKNKLIDPSTI